MESEPEERTLDDYLMQTGYVYFIQAIGVDLMKIGFTTHEDPRKRLTHLKIGSPLPLRLITTIPATRYTERKIHRRFAHLWSHGEWFRLTPELIRAVKDYMENWGKKALPMSYSQPSPNRAKKVRYGA